MDTRHSVPMLYELLYKRKELKKDSMNITFLIGNGFDRNLGLNTTYSDFTKHYKNLETNNERIKQFRKDIDDDKELWFDAEIAMGKYTEKFGEGEAAAYSECHTDFCMELAKYLKNEEKRIDFNNCTDIIAKHFTNINNLINIFPTQEREVLNSIYHNRRNESITFNFICFNYTSTLDECISIAKKTPGSLGSHKIGNQVSHHTIDKVCHVHGTVNKEMVFGVNDESQIAKPEIFNCENGDLYKNTIIKVQTNASYLENTDAKANQIIQNSSLIYVYGMSIGDTDKLWWDRICSWLAADSNRHLIVHKYSMPAKTVVQIGYQIAERTARKDFIRHSTKLNDAQKNNIESRIHITSENIFSGMNKLSEKKFIAPDGKNLLWGELEESAAVASKLSPQIAVATEVAEKIAVKV